MIIYSIKNEKLGFFNRPIYAENDSEVKSYILNILQSDADRALIHLKEDLSLYCIGTFDSESGKLCPSLVPNDDMTDLIHQPIKVCDLYDLFCMIPEDKIPRSENELREAINSIGKSVDVLVEDIKSIKGELKLCKKVNRKY